MQVIWIDQSFSSDVHGVYDAFKMLSGGATSEGTAALAKIRSDRSGRFYKSCCLLPCGIETMSRCAKVVEQHEKDKGFKVDIEALCSLVQSFTMPTPSQFKSGKDLNAF